MVKFALHANLVLEGLRKHKYLLSYFSIIDAKMWDIVFPVICQYLKSQK